MIERSLRDFAAIALLASTLLLTACGADKPPASGFLRSSMPVYLATLMQGKSDNQYVRMQYPRIAGPDAARLNAALEHWIGGHCPVPQAKSKIYPTAAACVAAFARHCADLRSKTPKDAVFGCTLDADTQIKVDAAGVLGAIYTTYAYTGGNHGSTVVSYLNLDLSDGRILALGDLLDAPDKIKLTRAIESAMRAQRHIPAGESLKKAGFFVDHLPPVDTVLALPQGLLFTYQSYDVGPYVLGQPHALVAWDQLHGMIRKDGPIPRLRALASGG